MAFCGMSCTRLRILLNTICRKPGFNSLSKDTAQSWSWTSEQWNSETDQMIPRAGKLHLKNTWQYCIPRPQAQRNSREANTGAQLRIARLQAPRSGKDKVIIHSPHGIKSGKICGHMLCSCDVKITFVIYDQLQEKESVDNSMILYFLYQICVKPVLELPSRKRASKVEPNHVSVKNSLCYVSFLVNHVILQNHVKKA